MQCGAETPPRASACPVCGHEIRGRAYLDAGWSEPHPVVTVDGRRAAQPGHPATTPSIAGGDLDQPGFPRDAWGRALVGVVIALAANLLAPWAIVGDQHLSPARLGWPALIAVVALGLAAVPTVRPAYRKRPLYAVAPLVVGAFGFGVVAVTWGLLAYVSYRIAAGPANAVTLVSADIGLYAFLVGCGALVAIGYHLFLEAATSVGVQATAAVPVIRRPSADPSAAFSASGSWRIEPIEPSKLNDSNQPPTAPRALLVTDPATNGNGAVPTTGAEQPGTATQLNVPLPGSAAWTQAPELPAPLRHTTHGADRMHLPPRGS
jgi:hypothetical protein